MKRNIFVILVIGLVLIGLLVSCKDGIEQKQEFGADLVSVWFNESSPRGLSASLEAFQKGDYYWAYAAQKADTSNLKSGETANYGADGEVHVWVKSGSQGLGDSSGAYKVSGFSQGYWNFKLFAYKDSTATELIYEGEARNVLLKSSSTNSVGSNHVSVVVNPVRTTAKGTLKILTATGTEGRVTMNSVNTATYGTDYIPRIVSVKNISTNTEYAGTNSQVGGTKDADAVFSLPAGSYKVTLAFSDANGTVNYARGSIIATVYSNLITTIKGDLNESVTFVDFDAELNPDLETVTVSKDIVYETDTAANTSVVITTDTSAAKAVTAEIKTTDTNSIITALATSMGTSDMSTYNQSLNLKLSVETVESAPTSATYEIGMTATLTSTHSTDTSDVKSTTSNVSSVDDYVTVTVQLQSGLSSVTVLHDGVPMIQGLNSTDVGNVGLYSYDPVSGVLTIKTKSFSPFMVSFILPSEDVYVAQVRNYRFTTLQSAIDSAKPGDTIKILRDITINSESTASGTALFKVEDKDVAIDGGNKTITVDNANDAGGGYVLEFHNSTGLNSWSVKDLTINATGYQVVLMANCDESATVALDNVEVTCDGECVYANGHVAATATDCEFTHDGIYAAGKDPVYYSGVIVGYGGDAVLENCSILSFGNGISTFPSGGSVTATNCTVSINGDSQLDENAGYALWSRNEDYTNNPEYVEDSVITIVSGTYYGTLKITQGNTHGSSGPAKIAKIVVSGGTFDHSPASYVADGYVAVKNDDGLYEVIPGSQIFASGNGTEANPYLISSLEELGKISDIYSYAHYKWNGDASVDASGWKGGLSLCGSFDGNGLELNNVAKTPFREVVNSSDSKRPSEDTVNTYTIKNLTVNANIISDGWISGVVRTVGVHDFVMENVKVHGYIEGSIGVASFITFGPGNKSPHAYDGKITFENCDSDATLMAKSGNAVGFIAHAMTATSSASVSLINSNYTGNMSAPNAASCKYVNGNWINATITDNQHTAKNGTVYSSSANGWRYTKAGCTGSFTVVSGTLPETIGDVFTIDALENATKAVFSLVISPDPGNYTSTYLTEEIEVSDGKFISDQVKYYKVRVNPQGVQNGGVNGTYYDVVNPTYNNDLGSATTVRVTQYDSSGAILQIRNISFNDEGSTL